MGERRRRRRRMRRIIIFYSLFPTPVLLLSFSGVPFRRACQPSVNLSKTARKTDGRLCFTDGPQTTAYLVMW